MRREMTNHTTSFRVGSSFPLPEVIRSLGHSPDAVFATARVDPTLYRHPENRIAAQDLGRLFACAAQLTARRDISLLVVSSFQPPGLGLVGELASEGPDVHTALRSLVRLLQYNTLAGYPTFTAAEPMSLLGFELRHYDFPGANFILRVRSAFACASCSGSAESNGSPRRCISADASHQTRDHSSTSSAHLYDFLPPTMQYCSLPTGLNGRLPASSGASIPGVSKLQPHRSLSWCADRRQCVSDSVRLVQTTSPASSAFHLANSSGA